MVNFLVIIIGTAIMSIIGGGLGYIVYVKTRPQKIAWMAFVYQLGDGIKPPIKDKSGKIVSDLRLRDLRPHSIDILEKIDVDVGQTIFRLIKNNLPTGAVVADAVDIWPDGKKIVNVLLEGESATVIKKGYDDKAGIIFSPLPYDRQNMIQNNMTIKKNRLQVEKDLLQKIAPYVAIGMSMMMVMGATYFIVDLIVETNRENGQQQRNMMEGWKSIAQINRETALVVSGKLDINNAKFLNADVDMLVKPPPLIDG